MSHHMVEVDNVQLYGVSIHFYDQMRVMGVGQSKKKRLNL